MMNFKQYTNVTKIVIPDVVDLSTTVFYNTFANMQSLVNIKFPNAITNMRMMFYYCKNLKTPPVCSPNVTNMASAYYNCPNITGSPVCGSNVTSMADAYYNCRNLTGSPVCGDKVTYMNGAYSSCTNLTGSPVCGPNVTNMSSAYYGCTNLTGAPVCGDKVQRMYQTYYNCQNLTGAPVCGVAVNNVALAYYNCKNVGQNAYFYSNMVSNVKNCFGSRNTSQRLNLYVPADSVTETYATTSNTSSLVGSTITWTSSSANGYIYNASYNIYVYPVANVAAAREANGD